GAVPQLPAGGRPVRLPRVEATGQPEVAVQPEDGHPETVVGAGMEQLDPAEARIGAARPEAVAELEMTRGHAADLDAVHLLAALVEDGQRKLLEDPGADGDGEPQTEERKHYPIGAGTGARRWRQPRV